jgi:putative protease
MALKAAIAAGADAVYLSGKRFGARKLAANFDQSQLKQAIDYAHLRGVKVYVTANTLIRDDELSDVANYFIDLYKIGADAILIQDVGATAMAGTLVPELDLHASTQMTIHNQAGVSWAAKMGMKRVVLAREVSLDDIRAMAPPVKIGLEVFIHGALCYCYSGQCLLSSAIGGRSGNRGFCAQPCRKPYVLLTGERDEYGRPMNLKAASLKNRFLISSRDLAVYMHLDKIVNSPVEALKIEGRMKSAEYVAIVTSIYRKALDAIAQGSWNPSNEDLRDLSLAFNRDFTDGYILGSKQIMGREMSDNRGILIGTVSNYDSKRGEASIRLTSSSPEQGDGLVFLSPDIELGLVVHRPIMKNGLLKLKTPERVNPGAKVFQTSSKSLSRKAQQIIAGERRKIPIDLEIFWEDEKIFAKGCAEGENQIQEFRFKAESRMEDALSRPLTAEQIETQLRKTGGTPFRIRKFIMAYPGGLFAPLSTLNQFRRAILANAEEALLKAQRPDPKKVEAARSRLKLMDLKSSVQNTSRLPSLAVYVNNFESVRGAAEAKCHRIYLEPHVGCSDDRMRRTIQMLKDAKSLCGESKLIWKWPRITKDKYLQLACELLQATDVDGIMVDGIGAAEAALMARPDVKIYGSAGLNIWNHLTVWQLSHTFQLLTLSPELSADQLGEIVTRSHLQPSPMLELIVQGNQEVMVTQDCITCLEPCDTAFWGLNDFRRVFPLSLDDNSMTHIFNSAETSLLDYMPTLFQIGLDGLAIDARGRTEKYALEMTEIYLTAIKSTERGGGYTEKNLQALKERIRHMVIGGMTSGHFIKALKEEIY